MWLWGRGWQGEEEVLPRVWSPARLPLHTGRPSPAHKMHLAAAEDIEDEALIRVRELHVLWGTGISDTAVVTAQPPPPGLAPTLYLLP